LATGVAAQGEAAPKSLTPEQQQAWRKTLAEYDYVGIAEAYADFMIEHGRDVYGPKQTPLFVTGMDRHTGKMISPPFAHVKRKPFMPGWERDRELRGSDRNYGNADPLDQLTLLKLMHRLSEVTGDKRYAEEADKTASWWLGNCQTGIGLYPWGTHTSWNVSKEGGGGTFEFNHVWPYWKLNPEALRRYAMGLWDHYVRDKKTGDFNRHANSSKHGPGGGMEFPWPGSAMIATWAEAHLASPDPEYVRAISTILKRWENLRDANGHLAPCSNYGEWAWYLGYMIAANRLDDFADKVEAQEPELAARMRDYGRKCDAAYLKVADNLLDVKRVGPVKSYLRATGGYNPDRLDIIGGPWQDRKDYAGFAVMLHERMKRNDSPELQKRYRRAVLDIAEIYMSINPEIQWAVWGVNVGNAMQLMLSAHDLTGNAAYLHRADHFGRLAVDLFLDEASPLPKFTSQDDYYEIESVTDPSGDVWMLAVLALHERLAKLAEPSRKPLMVRQTGAWDCTAMSKPSASVLLPYGKDGEKSLFLSRREKGFVPATGRERGPVDTTGPTVRPVVPTGRSKSGMKTMGLPVDGLELIVSDFINKIPTLDEAKPFNGPYRRRFSGKHRERSTASYGGFKDVLDKAELQLVNHGTQAAEVTVTVTLHDSWDDRETKDYTVTLKAGARTPVSCDSPEKRFIRRLDFKSSVPGAVKLERFAFAMTPRSKLNPLSPGTSQASTGPQSSPPPKEPKGPPFGGAKPKLITDGLVLDLVGNKLAEVNDSANASQRPQLVTDKGKPVLRFDGKDDFLSISDSDALDLKAWTIISLVRATGGPGVVIGKIDGKNFMMNYRLQVDGDGKVAAVVRGASARQQVNRQARVNVLTRFAVVAARFDPKARGVEKVTISVDGRPVSYSYQNAEGELTSFTHNATLLIGRQPGRESRYFKGDIAGILLYNRALSEEEQNSAARWLVEQRAGAEATGAKAATLSKEALVFLIAGQSNAGGVAAFSPETNKKAGMHEKHPTIPGSTAEEVGIPTTTEAYPRSYIWTKSFERLAPGKNLMGGYRDPWRHGIELPMAMLLEKEYRDSDKFFVKHGPGGHNLHTQWAAGLGPDYKSFIKQFNGAMDDLKKRYGKVRIIGLYWDQGESDRPKAQEYGKNLRALFAALRKDTGIPDLQIFVRKHLFQHGDESFVPLLNAQVEVTKEDPNAHLLDLDLGSNEKNFQAWAWTDKNGHLSSKAYLELSERIVRRHKEHT
jgi:hypothetical protein